MHDTQWWLAVPEPGILLWARLRLCADGAAEVLDAAGELVRFDDLDGGRHYLLSADYRAWDGLDADDAGVLGFDLAHIAPPASVDERLLLRAMTLRLR